MFSLTTISRGLESYKLNKTTTARRGFRDWPVCPGRQIKGVKKMKTLISTIFIYLMIPVIIMAHIGKSNGNEGNEKPLALKSYAVLKTHAEANCLQFHQRLSKLALKVGYAYFFKQSTCDFSQSFIPVTLKVNKTPILISAARKSGDQEGFEKAYWDNLYKLYQQGVKDCQERVEKTRRQEARKGYSYEPRNDCRFPNWNYHKQMKGRGYLVGLKFIKPDSNGVVESEYNKEQESSLLRLYREYRNFQYQRRYKEYRFHKAMEHRKAYCEALNCNGGIK